MSKGKTILVAPLYWGLGHASRCVPIIKSLIKSNYNVIIASDGAALQFLQNEFPSLESLELPSYNIRYPKIGSFFKLKMISLLPGINKTKKAERKIVQNLVDQGKIQGIISDGRLGVRSTKIPSVYITHQLNVLTGGTTYFSSLLHQRVIRKFDACWVPDTEHEILNLSGRLGHLKSPKFPVKYLGILSRLQKENLPITTDILVLLSGPEPQRTMLESKLKKELSKSDKSIVMIRGVVEPKQQWSSFKNIKIVNFMQSEELEKAINQSNIIVSRPGYSTIMDLAVLEKNTFFIPTPGQYEQEYLAKRLRDSGICPSCSQRRFTLERLNKASVYRGLQPYPNDNIEVSSFFGLF